MKTFWSLVLCAGVLLTVAPSAAQAQQRFKLLATNQTGTMEDELNEAGADGYRFVAVQGGETEFGGDEVVVVMARDPEGRRFRYILLATTRTSTMERELNEAPRDFQAVGMTVFESMFGGLETAVILEAEIAR